MAAHLTPDEREEIYCGLRQGLSKAEIARRLGRSPSTIFRELKRNSTRAAYSLQPKYHPILAQCACEARRHRCRQRKLMRPALRSYVEQRLKQYWSPDQIAGRLARDFPDEPQCQVSHQAIYNWLSHDDHHRHLCRFLRRFPHPKRRPATTKPRREIAQRPAIIELRQRVGDWEGDTIVGARHRGALVSLVERRTGYLLLAKVSRPDARQVAQRITRRLRALPADLRQSITFDRGKEFARHADLTASLGIDVYFADPYCPWQRGTNEHTNGLVRQFLPKKTSFRDLTSAQVREYQALLNHRPRKRLHYQTPAEALGDASHALLT